MRVAVNTTKILFLIGCLLACCVAGCLVVGCSSNSNAEPSAEEQSAEPSIPTFGEQTETALSVNFTNGTGSEIVNIAVAPAGSTDEPAFLFEEDQVLGDGEQLLIYVEPYDEQTLFDVTIVIGENRFVLHNLNFATTDEVTIHLEGDVAYLEIIMNGEPVSTLSDEYDIAHPPVEEVAEEPVYEYYSYNAGGVSQSGDGCIEGGVLLR